MLWEQNRGMWEMKEDFQCSEGCQRGRPMNEGRWERRIFQTLRTASAYIQGRERERETQR